MEKNQLAVIEQKASSMMEKIKALVITTAGELAAASDMTKSVKQLATFIKAEKEKFTAPAKQIIATAKEKYDPYLAQCEEAEAILKGKSRDYLIAEEKKAEEARAKIVKKVEAGRMKPETAMDRLSNVQEPPKKAVTEASSLTMTKRKDIRIINQALIPDVYYKPRELDMMKLRRAVTSGIEVPGTELIEIAVMSSR